MRKRLFKFGIGILIGCFASFMFFGDHDWFGWLPNGRILVKIQDTIQEYPPKVDCLINCYSLDSTHMAHLFYEGDVDFAESVTREEPRIYYIDYLDSLERTIQGTFKIYGDSATVFSNLKILGDITTCPCNGLSDMPIIEPIEADSVAIDESLKTGV